MRWLITLALNLDRCAVQNYGLGKSRGLAGYCTVSPCSWAEGIASRPLWYILFEQVYYREKSDNNCGGGSAAPDNF